MVLFFILAMYIAIANGVYIPTAIKIITWAFFSIDVFCAVFEAWKEING